MCILVTWRTELCPKNCTASNIVLQRRKALMSSFLQIVSTLCPILARVNEKSDKTLYLESRISRLLLF